MLKYPRARSTEIVNFKGSTRHIRDTMLEPQTFKRPYTFRCPILSTLITIHRVMFSSERMRSEIIEYNQSDNVSSYFNKADPCSAREMYSTARAGYRVVPSRVIFNYIGIDTDNSSV